MPQNQTPTATAKKSTPSQGGNLEEVLNFPFPLAQVLSAASLVPEGRASFQTCFLKFTPIPPKYAQLCFFEPMKISNLTQ